MTEWKMEGNQLVFGERKLPVLGSYDVVVAGGGMAGCGAALGAAKTGARVLREAKAANTGAPIGASLAELAKASPRAAAFAAAENAAEDLWQLCLKIPGECGKAFTEKVVVAD